MESWPEMNVCAGRPAEICRWRFVYVHLYFVRASRFSLWEAERRPFIRAAFSTHFSRRLLPLCNHKPKLTSHAAARPPPHSDPVHTAHIQDILNCTITILLKNINIISKASFCVVDVGYDKPVSYRTWFTCRLKYTRAPGELNVVFFLILTCLIWVRLCPM